MYGSDRIRQRHALEFKWLTGWLLVNKRAQRSERNERMFTSRCVIFFLSPIPHTPRSEVNIGNPFIHLLFSLFARAPFVALVLFCCRWMSVVDAECSFNYFPIPTMMKPFNGTLFLKVSFFSRLALFRPSVCVRTRRTYLTAA